MVLLSAVGPAPGYISRVSQVGCIRWKKHFVHVSRLLANECVALQPIAVSVWSVYFGPVHLGWLDEHDYRIMDVRRLQKKPSEL